jgi:2-amino-4-hydroxy-6-hydroxymethyldihydropteridine diphosphokinase
MGRVARPVAIALGSNLGDREAHLRFAIDALASRLAGIRASSFIETAPVETTGDQPFYLNAAAVGWTDLPARAILDLLLDLEARRGRERPYHHAPRTLDLDLVLAGAEILDEPGLVVPHACFRERAFVLGPLCEVAPDLIDPVTGLTIRDLLARLI